MRDRRMTARAKLLGWKDVGGVVCFGGGDGAGLGGGGGGEGGAGGGNGQGESGEQGKQKSAEAHGIQCAWCGGGVSMMNGAVGRLNGWSGVCLDFG